MWVVTLHRLFLYLDPSLPCHPLSCWLRLFLSQTFSHINTPKFSNLVILHTYLPMKMEQAQSSETSAYKIQTSGIYPEERIHHDNTCMAEEKDYKPKSPCTVMPPEVRFDILDELVKEYTRTRSTRRSHLKLSSASLMLLV